MKTDTDKRIRAGYMTAFILLFFSYILTFYTAEKLRDKTLLVNYTNNLISNFDNLLSGIRDAQRGSRGHFITGDPNFLDPYQKSSRIVDAAYNNLTDLLKDEKFATTTNRQQFDRLMQLRDRIKREYTTIEAALSSFKQNNFK